MRRILVAMGLGLGLAGPAAAQSGDATTGLAVARAWCANCHVVERHAATAGDSVPSFVAIAARPSLTAEGLQNFLAAPHGRMPNLTLSRGEIDNAAAYILSLRKR